MYSVEFTLYILHFTLDPLILATLKGLRLSVFRLISLYRKSGGNCAYILGLLYLTAPVKPAWSVCHAALQPIAMG